MSFRIGIDTLHLRPTPRLAHTEYLDHEPYIRHVEARTGQRHFQALDYDLLFHTHDGPIDWRAAGRVTDMGHAVYAEGGRDFRAVKPCPFGDVDEVYAFDAVDEYGLPDLDELVRFYEARLAELRTTAGDVVIPGGYYRTVVSGAIESFGWDMLLEAAAEPKRFAPVLESFFRRTMHHVRAWAQTSMEAFIQHDDFVWSEGAFMHPTFYREHIIPHYAELWQVLRDAGKRVLFCSDGNWIEFVDDIAQAGAHGFIFEPMMPLEPVVERYGGTHVIVSSKVDCRTLAFGTPAQIRAEIDATLAIARDCPGFVFAVGNHISGNVPMAHIDLYMDHLRGQWSREDATSVTTG